MTVRSLWRNVLAVPVLGLVVTAATALALFSLAASHDFWSTGLSGALLVVAIGIAARAFIGSRALVVALQLTALTGWATQLIGPGDALLGLLPTPTTAMTLTADVQRVMEMARMHAAPLPVSRALTTAMALGVAVLGLLVDGCAATARRAAPVGLILLGIYMVPVAILSGQVSMHAFWPGALAWVGLLLAAERTGMSRWTAAGSTSAESTSPGSTAAPTDAGGLGGPWLSDLDERGRQVGLGAVGLALVLPLLLPAASLQLFGTGGTLGGGDGQGPDVITVDNPVLDLRRNLVDQPKVELLRVRTDDPDPAYLRTTVLDDFTGDRWQPSSRDEDQSVDADEDTLPPAPGLTSGSAGRDVRYEVTITAAFSSSWLPVVYAPTSIDADGDWRVDENTLDVVIGDQEQAATSTTYSFTAAVPQPTVEQMRNAPPPPDSLDALTDLPPSTPVEIARQAVQVTSGADTDYDKAVALEEWFRADGGFVYSTEPRAGTGSATIAAFVTDDRVGYCEQYASAMALMARSLGIPARVSVGFLRPDRVGTDTWSYQGGDLHTWPELYFSGAGWVRFEPTPADRTGGNATTAPQQEQVPNKTDRGPQKGVTPASSRSGFQVPLRAVSLEPMYAVTRIDSWVLVGLAALVVAASIPLAVRTLRRRRRWSRAATDPTQVPEVAWEEVGDGVVDLGRPWDRYTTPRAAGRAVRPFVDGNPSAVESLNRLVRSVERRRFAAATDDATGPDDALATARADVDVVLASVTDGCTGRQRHLARWLPRSAWSVAAPRATWQRLRVRSA